MEISEINETLLQKHCTKLIDMIGSIGGLHIGELDNFTTNQMTLLIINLRKEIAWSAARLEKIKRTEEQPDKNVRSYELGEKYKEG